MVALAAPFDLFRVPLVGHFLALVELKRHAHRHKADQINTQRLGHRLGLLNLMFVGLHDDELPLDNRCLAAARIAAPNQFGHVGHHAVKITADSVLEISFRGGTVQRDHQIFKAAVDQMVQVLARCDHQVRTQVGADIRALRVVDHLEDFLVDQRLAPVVQIRFKQIAPVRLEVVLEMLQRHHRLLAPEIIQAGWAQRTTQIAEVAGVDDEQVRVAVQPHSAAQPLIFNLGKIGPLCRCAVLNDRLQVAGIARVLWNLAQQFFSDRHAQVP